MRFQCQRVAFASVLFILWTDSLGLGLITLLFTGKHKASREIKVRLIIWEGFITLYLHTFFSLSVRVMLCVGGYYKKNTHPKKVTLGYRSG